MLAAETDKLFKVRGCYIQYGIVPEMERSIFVLVHGVRFAVQRGDITNAL